MENIFFNRVPIAGYKFLMRLINELRPVNKFKLFSTKVENIVKKYSFSDLDQLSEDVTLLDEFSIYVAPLYYLNFTERDFPRPIYINMISDPVDRIIRWYNYIRTPRYIAASRKNNTEIKLPKALKTTNYASCVRNKDEECVYEEGSGFQGELDYKRQMIHFCGYDETVCIPFNSLATLQRAKKNVEEEYAVIGTWEDTNVTLTVFENYIPKYFKGITSMYNDLKHYGKIPKQNKVETNDSYIKDIVRKQFQREIEFYEFCRQRLHKQYIALNLVKMQQ